MGLTGCGGSPEVVIENPAEPIEIVDRGYGDDAGLIFADAYLIKNERQLKATGAESVLAMGVDYKANALVVVARKIQRRYGGAIKNVVLLDDDTELADDFFIRHDLLADPKVGGYCVGIAINRSPPLNLWEIAIDFEYRAISHAFGARATVATLPFCHGICAVYKLDLMIEMYSKNWSLPGG